MTISPSSDKWVRHGRDLNITCTFSSKYQESIQLFHEGSVARVSDRATMTLETFTDADGKQTTVLRYLKTNTKFEDKGTYECAADNRRKSVNIQVVQGGFFKIQIVWSSHFFPVFGTHVASKCN